MSGSKILRVKNSLPEVKCDPVLSYPLSDDLCRVHVRTHGSFVSFGWDPDVQPHEGRDRPGSYQDVPRSRGSLDRVGENRTHGRIGRGKGRERIQSPGVGTDM